MAEHLSHGADFDGPTNPSAIGPGGRGRSSITSWRDDFITAGIAVAALLLFVGTAGVVVPDAIRGMMGQHVRPDSALTNALLLNVALILLGMQRFRTLKFQLSASRRSEQEALRLIDLDELTGALSRRAFSERLTGMLDLDPRSGKAVAVLAIDIDGFKQFNDVHGHQAGDAVLKTTAARIRRIAPAGSLMARLGGDTFACALPYYSAVPDRIDHLANRLLEQGAGLVEHDGESLEITLSIGIASSEQLDERAIAKGSALALVHKCEIAMYHARKRGKNGFYWFESAMEQELRFRSELEGGIRRGIARGEFIPYYEQQIDLQSGRLMGFEMLARWESPELGLVGPEIFIPIAEEIGVIGELSESLIARAFEDAKHWPEELTLSVNISPVQMRDPWFAQKILKLLLVHNFPPHRLDIEITETCLHDNIGLARSMVTSLRNQGVRVSLDDFGTGYASLAQLRTLPFDSLKIDRSFIADLRGGSPSATLVDAIVAMGAGLEMPVTAEGVEDEEILSVLKGMGKLKAQGYHYGRPETAEQVLDRLAQVGALDAHPESREGKAVVRGVFGTAEPTTGGDARSA